MIGLPYLLTGLVIIERTLQWPGLGSVLLLSVETRDIPIMMGTLAVAGAITLLARISLDAVVLLLDPRLRGRALNG